MTPFLESTAPRERSASALAAALAARAEQVCAPLSPRRGRKQGRYWTVGDVHGTEGRSLYVRTNASNALATAPRLVERPNERLTITRRASLRCGCVSAPPYRPTGHVIHITATVAMPSSPPSSPRDTGNHDDPIP